MSPGNGLGDSSDFASLLRQRFLLQAESAPPSAWLDPQSALDALDRERQAYREKLQRMSALRFHLAELLQVAGWRLSQLGRWVMS